MSNITSFIQRTVADLSARVRAASALVAAPANPAFGGGNPVGTGQFSNHMNSAWLGDFAETGCVKTTYVTKRITTGSLTEVLT